jgi:hypothetical protein
MVVRCDYGDCRALVGTDALLASHRGDEVGHLGAIGMQHLYRWKRKRPAPVRRTAALSSFGRALFIGGAAVSGR